MERDEDNTYKLIKTIPSGNELNQNEIILHFIEEAHAISVTLHSCESCEDLFKKINEHFLKLGYNSVLFFRSKNSDVNDFSLVSQTDKSIGSFLEEELKLIHEKIIPQNELQFFNSASFKQSNQEYLYAYPFNTLQKYILYVTGSNNNLATKEYTKFFKLVGSLVKNQLARIEELQEVKKIKESLEQLIDKKSSDLDRVVEALSQQYSELKYQHDKRAELIKEIHHRVNNNLQVISSLLSLYISSSDAKERIALKDVRDRVQVMALIHLNVYKSVEMNLIDFKSYLRDLFSYLRSVNTEVKLYSNITTNVNTIKLDTLVPLGLLITEVINYWLKKTHLEKLNTLELVVTIKKDIKTNIQKLVIKDKHSIKLLSDLSNIDLQDQITTILLSALTEQLEGDFKVDFIDSNEFRFTFMD